MSLRWRNGLIQFGIYKGECKGAEDILVNKSIVIPGKFVSYLDYVKPHKQCN